MTWLASKGSMKFISTIAEPILPTQQVDWASAEPGSGSNSEELPNIIILADDLGWNDISFYGGGLGDGAVQTPNIDRIAAEGALAMAMRGNATCVPLSSRSAHWEISNAIWFRIYSGSRKRYEYGGHI